MKTTVFEMEICVLFSGDGNAAVKESNRSTLEVTQHKKRTPSISSVDILISPCEPHQKPDERAPDQAISRPVTSETTLEKTEVVSEKPKLVAAVSYPLERKAVKYLSSPTLSESGRSMSSIVYNPVDQDKEVNWATFTTAEQGAKSPSMPRWGACFEYKVHPSHLPKVTVVKSGGTGETTEFDFEEKIPRPSQQGAATSDTNQANEEKDPSDEHLLLVAEDQMYPTLRSKSLNTNPRRGRIKNKESEEKPRSASSVRDLVAAFSGTAEDKTD